MISVSSELPVYFVDGLCMNSVHWIGAHLHSDIDVLKMKKMFTFFTKN